MPRELLPSSAHVRIFRLELLASGEHLSAISGLVLELPVESSCLFSREGALLLRRSAGCV
jgi:hypothetical protein